MKKSRRLKKHPHHLVAAHRHTGHALPRQHSSYALLTFIMLCLGVLLFGVSSSVQAGFISVTATVAGAPPPSAAVIVQPLDGQHFQEIPIDVNGSCPAGYLVRITKNDVLAGSMLCDSGGNFALQIDLFQGQNTLAARVYNAAEIEGPRSPEVTVYYEPVTPVTPPVIVPPTDTPSSSGTPTILNPSSPTAPAQLIITGKNYYKGYNTGDTTIWPLDIEGGSAPYAINIEWGDGSNQLLIRKLAGAFEAKHVYKKPGGFKGSYKIKIRASDNDGQSAFLQLMTLVNNTKPAVISDTEQFSTLQTLQLLQRQLALSWPLYLVTLLMVISFWLGERRERSVLMRRLRRYMQLPRIPA